MHCIHLSGPHCLHSPSRSVWVSLVHTIPWPCKCLPIVCRGVPNTFFLPKIPAFSPQIRLANEIPRLMRQLCLLFSACLLCMHK